ncbi:MAG: hypothetical protein V3T72_11135 [Thermoanaerobaculia bacterium]
MAKRVALIFLGISAPVILLTFLVAIPAGEIVFSLLAVAFPVALIALGASGRRRQLGPLVGGLAVLALLLEGFVVVMLVLRGQVLDGPWVGGLPLATAVQVYGLFLTPLLLVSLLYALTFERFGLRRQDLDELRRRYRKEPPE